jgi:hypothetical protein
MAAQTLPAGTALPIMVSTTLNAGKDKPGQRIEGKLMQDVRLAEDSVLKKGSRITGQVVSIAKPSRITLQFTQLQEEHHNLPLNVSLRALAASASVFQAGLPVGASTSAESDEWVTQQIGGEYVFRGRGYVSSDRGKIGRWDGSGVWGKLAPGDDCLDTDDTGQEQALWIFSTTACGAYGFDDLKIAADGSQPPQGQITLETGKDGVRGGSGWLLVVNAAKSSATGHEGVPPGFMPRDQFRHPRTTMLFRTTSNLISRLQSSSLR